MSAQITRSAGIPTGCGYLVGNGYEGKTKELDGIVYDIAEQLREMYGKDVEIRYNCDRESGGAFVRDNDYSCKIGIGARLVSSVFRSMTRKEQIDFPMEDYGKLPKDTIIYHIVLDESVAKPGVDAYSDFETTAEAFEFLKNNADQSALNDYLEKLKRGI